MFLTPLLGIIKYEGLHGIIYRVLEKSLLQPPLLEIDIFANRAISSKVVLTTCSGPLILDTFQATFSNSAIV